MPPVVGAIAGIGTAIGGAQSLYNGVNNATGGAIGRGIGGLLQPGSTGQGGSGVSNAENATAGQGRMDRQLQQQAYQGLLGQAGAENPEFVKARGDIATQGSEAQQQFAGQQNVAMNQQGVRGGQAVNLMKRGQGQLAENLNQQMTDFAMQEQARKQKEKLAALTMNPDMGVK